MISLEKLIDKISDKLNSISHLNKSKIESIEVRSSNKSDSPTLKQNTNSLSTCKTESEVTNFKICNDKIEYNRIGPFDDSREENLLKDMSMDSSAKDDFVKYLIFKHHRDNEIKSIKLLQSWKEELSSELNIDERACIICNDGDYDKDDLIVYCAVSRLFYYLYLLKY